MQPVIIRSVIVSSLLFVAGCSSSTSTNTGNGTTLKNYSFPQGLAVVSPFNKTSFTSAVLNEGLEKMNTSTSTRTVASYEDTIEQINTVLDGTGSPQDLFDAEQLRTQAVDAGCFGPELSYQNHPDGVDLSPPPGALYPILPTGDLGLWTETDLVSGEACAAAQLNARMQDVEARSTAALLGLASLLQVASDASISEPTAGNSIDLSSEMNLLAIANTTFSTATLALDASGAIWSYQLTFDYAANGSSNTMSISLQHAAGSTDDDYKGLLSYQVEDNFQGGNCPSQDVTFIGSLLYEKTSATALSLQQRNGTFCGHSLINGFDANGLADPTDTYDNATNINGWGNNFSIFTANFNPQDQAGEYSYAWQAGPMDSHSRLFNIAVNSTSPQTAEAYYGYGANVGNTDGTINGFICNWAGPGNDHTLQNYAQRQFISFDETNNLFSVSMGSSDITYAPTVACTYDSDNGGSFLYDRDLDNDLSDETSATVDVGTGETLELDLFPNAGVYVGMSVVDAIADRGYNNPTPPTPAIP